MPRLGNWPLIGVLPFLACAAGSAVFAQQYAFVPDTMKSGPTHNAVICTTPSGWVGRKNDPDYWKGVSASDRPLIEGADSAGVYFTLPGCRFRPGCPAMKLDTTGLDAPEKASARTGLDILLREIHQHQGRGDPDSSVTQLADFDAGALGRPIIWQIRSTFAQDYLVVVLVRRDLLITAYLKSDDIKAIQDRLASLRELVRSIRIVPATFSTPDIIRISNRQPDAAIRRELLQLTPRGMPMAQVAEVVETRLMKESFEDHGETKVTLRTADEIQISLGYESLDARALEAIGHNQTFPPVNTVRAVWLFDRAGKLRKVEVRRFAVH